jgi:hypothetical protein
MNAVDRHDLDQEPVPSFEGAPARAGVGMTFAGWRLYWLVGVERQWFGPVYDRPREAARAAAHLNARTRA